MPIFGSTKPHNYNTSDDRREQIPKTHDYANTHGGGHRGAGIGGAMPMDDTYARDTYGRDNMAGVGTGPGHVGTHPQGYAAGDPYEANIPSAAAMNAGFDDNVNRKHGGSGSSMTGKIEQAAGTVLGSKSLRAKGLQKEQEAKAAHIQSAELAEAERLEHQARMRRERAVAHGADPAHRELGAGTEFKQF